MRLSMVGRDLTRIRRNYVFKGVKFYVYYGRKATEGRGDGDHCGDFSALERRSQAGKSWLDKTEKRLDTARRLQKRWSRRGPKTGASHSDAATEEGRGGRFA